MLDMKNIFYVLIAASMLFSACSEKTLVIPELSAGKKRILIEEITGVNCPNCPDGARELSALQDQFGKENMIIVGIHAGGNLSSPITGSKFDFQLQEGYDMTNYIGTLFGLPSASINRIEDPADQTPFLIGGWAAQITNELEKDYGLDIFIKNTYNAETRSLDIKVNLAPEKPINEEVRLTVVITQDSIFDAQYDGTKLIPQYMHRHVLRDVVSKTDGDIITDALPANALVQKQYTVKLSAAWEPKHCSVVAYLQRGSASTKEIMQVSEAHVIE